MLPGPSAAAAAATAPASRRRRGAWWLLLACSYVLLLLFYKLWPGMLPTLPISLLEFGSSACLAQRPWYELTCATVGMPRGLVVAFGLPVIWLSALWQRLFGLEVATAYQLSEALFVLAALWGAVRFFDLFSGSTRGARWIALFVAALYLMAPNIAREDIHGALRIGFALVPAYLFADVVFTRALRAGAAWPRLAAGAVMLTALRSFALFLDGYSFVMALLVAGLLWAFTLVPMLWHGPRWRALAGGVLGLLTALLPVLLYRAYIPESNYPTMPLDFFRGQGIDAYFFVVPAISLWLPTLLGLAVDIPGPVVHSVGPSSRMTYIGYALFAGGIGVALLLWRRRLRITPLGLALAVAGGIALLLALGPEFKWMNFDWKASDAITFQTYLMPAGSGRFALPTAWLYENIPGIEVMRALYRWVLLPRLALLAALAALLAWLLARHTRGALALAALLGVLALAENLPDVPTLLARGAQNAREYTAMRAGPIAELQALTRPGQRALFLPAHPNASRNPYLANLLCAEARLHCYDVGGDKARRISAEDWPAPVAQVAENERPLANARRVLEEDLADVVIVPLFDLRWNAGRWPPVDFPRSDALATARQLAASVPGALLASSEWIAVVHRDATRPVARDSAADSAPQPHAQVLDWGPHRLAASAADSYLWVKLTNAPLAPRLLLDDWPLLTYRKDDGTVAAWIRRVDWQHFRSGGSHQLILLDDASRSRQVIGRVQIAPSMP